MSGIFGIISNKPIDTDLLNQSIAIQNHRGRMITKYRLNNEINQSHDISFVNYSNDIESCVKDNFLIIADARIYNRNNLLLEINENNLNISQTEMILRAYIKWGERCVNHFEGKWAFAIFDKLKKTLFLSRDRFGMCPLYYTFSDNVFIFSSEIKTIYNYEPLLKKIQQNQLYEYLQFGKILQRDETLFYKIKELLPAHNLRYDLITDKFFLGNYYDITKNISKKVITSQYDTLFQYEDLVKGTINQILNTTKNTGIFLSGGLDSSSLAAFAMKTSDLTAFTAIYENNEIDESHYAKCVSTHLKIKNHILVTPDAYTLWDDFRKIVWHQDSPVASTTIFAQWELFKQARNINISSIISGTGADGPLGGFSISSGILLLNLIKHLKLKRFISEFNKLIENRRISPSREIIRAFLNLLPYKYQELLRPGFKQMPNLLIPEFKQLDYKPHFMDGFKKSDFTSFCIRGINSGLVELLRYEDRNSNAFGIESHTPFLNHNLVEFTLNLSDDYKLRDGFSKYILRKIVEAYLPSEVVWRQDKKGFSTPQLQWKSQLQKRIEDYVSSVEIPDFFDRRKVLQYVTKKEINSRDLSEFWRFISILFWFTENKLSVA
jgi:asparagine synthase (glutamine-hydrolysing)